MTSISKITLQIMFLYGKYLWLCLAQDSSNERRFEDVSWRPEAGRGLDKVETKYKICTTSEQVS